MLVVMLVLGFALPVDVYDFDGHTPLQFAVTGGLTYATTTEVLLRLGASPDAADKAGLPVLHAALELDNLDAATLLLRFGAQPAAKNPATGLDFYDACRAKNREKWVSKMLCEGSEPRFKTLVERAQWVLPALMILVAFANAHVSFLVFALTLPICVLLYFAVMLMVPAVHRDDIIQRSPILLALLIYGIVAGLLDSVVRLAFYASSGLLYLPLFVFGILSLYNGYRTAVSDPGWCARRGIQPLARWPVQSAAASGDMPLMPTTFSTAGDMAMFASLVAKDKLDAKYFCLTCMVGYIDQVIYCCR